MYNIDFCFSLNSSKSDRLSLKLIIDVAGLYAWFYYI